MENLLSLKTLTNDEIIYLVNRALELKKGAKPANLDACVANLFFEPSTRTHYSFIRAEQKLGLEVLDFNPSGSSLKKGETLNDTVKLFQSLGADVLVIRHEEDRYYEKLIDNINIPIINAGDGKGDHPTQSLLDIVTIYESFNRLEGLKCVIYGDLSHSRVANTNIDIFNKLGIKVETVSPPGFEYNESTTNDLSEAIIDADIVMGLRIQHERHSEHFTYTQEDYVTKFGLDENRLKLLKPECIIMHPAPVNRGWEMIDAAVDGPKSRIFQQMANGVYVRMAVLERSLVK
ncbi:MAG: aspartate carbamoyltransferase catalytic subunit [Tissierellia bacterium]|nr:aspartate carbamoyltransferase catalytic subunit [Tissierellia bacterium]